MEHKRERLRTLPFEELKRHPEMLTDFLSSHDSVPIFMEKRGDTVSVGAVPAYSRETDRILEEVLAEYGDMKRQGYSREDGFAELEALQHELAKRTD